MKNNHSHTIFEKISSSVTKASGSSLAFVLAVSIIALWLFSGPFFHYSDTWQLIINTGTTIVTFLMVFLIQRSQNKDPKAIHLKLNELLASSERASNRLVCIEEISEEEMKILQKFYKRLALKSKQLISIHQSHSINEADVRHEQKNKNKQTLTKHK